MTEPFSAASAGIRSLRAAADRSIIKAMTGPLFPQSARIAAMATLLLVCLAGPAAPSPDASVRETVQAVEKHYRELTTLNAKVRQKNFLRSLDKTQVFEGTIWIKKPDRLRIEYTNGQVILVDRKNVLFYSQKSEQLIKKRFTDFARMNLPVAFLLGAGSITDDFDIASPDPKTPGRVELVPKKPGAGMKRLVLAADAEGRISELTIHDKSGNITEIVFSGIQEGIRIKNTLFSFTPPKGTEIIEQ